MPFDGNGNYVPPSSSFNPAVAATDIDPTDWDSLLTDLSTALSTTITKDGQTVVTADIPMGGFKLTGLAAPTASGDALSYGADDGTFTPTDASGAGLVFTSPVGYYRRIGTVAHIWGSLTYPATADGTVAKIGGLPVTSANLTMDRGFPGTVNFGGGGGTPGGAGPNWLYVNINATTMAFAYAGGVGLTNALLSGYAVDFYATYPV